MADSNHTYLYIASFERRNVVSGRILQSLVRVVDLWPPSYESAMQSLQRQLNSRPELSDLPRMILVKTSIRIAS